jgi:hypothetical protein
MVWKTSGGVTDGFLDGTVIDQAWARPSTLPAVSWCSHGLRRVLPPSNPGCNQHPDTSKVEQAATTAPQRRQVDITPPPETAPKAQRIAHR